jgi:signal transduction histidine kinase
LKKSIFGNLVIGSFLVVGLVLIFFTVYFTTYLERIAVNEKVKTLRQNVEEIQEATYYSLVNQSDATDYMFQSMIDNVSYNTQSMVTVFDLNGFVIADTDPTTNKDTFKRVNESVTKRVLKGNDIVTMEVYRSEKGEKILTVGAPLTNGEEVFGGVMFNQLVPEIRGMYAFVANKMIIIIILSMVFSAFLFYILSLKITSPIKTISAAVMEFSKGNFKKRVEYSVDNELGELAQNINHMASSLDNLEQLRQGFISDVSHELRTPLTTISGFVEGILDGTIPKESQEEYLDVVLSESKRLSRLITNLLQLTHMESGKARVDRTDFDINELARLALLKFEMMITPKGIDVSMNMDKDKLMVNADKDMITQVLINLINNAVKFTPNGGKISIDIEDKKDKAVISVTNTGHGIEPEKLQFIWDRFYKVDKSRSEDRTGMGLGLYIVKSIINLHKENITADSKLNEYTRFTFTLKKAE